MEFLNNLWTLFIDMSYYIVIGLIFTGLLHAFINKDAILKHIGKDSTSSVVKASILGVPLPLCSCGVVPTAMYLGKNGASKGAVVSFLTSTPQTGVDSIIATYGLMGPLFAAYRAVSAFISGIISGIATNIFCRKDDSNYTQPEKNCCSVKEKDKEATTPACACSQTYEATVSVPACSCSNKETKQVESPTCACSSRKSVVSKPTFINKIKKGFTYAFGDFLDEIALNFVIGLIIAALISTFIPQAWLSSFSNPFLNMLMMLIIGIPMYICSTASIPIALSLMMKGISPGAAFVFLFAGPITNIASLAILGKTLGKKVLILYLTCASVCAILFGMLLDLIIDISGYTGISNMIHNAHSHTSPIYMIVIASLFGVLVLISLLKRIKITKKKASCCSH